MTESEKRLVDLEMRFMKLERFTHELSDVVAKQQRSLDALTAEAKRLKERLLDVGDPMSSDKPPHLYVPIPRG